MSPRDSPGAARELAAKVRRSTSFLLRPAAATAVFLDGEEEGAVLNLLDFGGRFAFFNRVYREGGVWVPPDLEGAVVMELVLCGAGVVSLLPGG